MFLLCVRQPISLSQKASLSLLTRFDSFESSQFTNVFNFSRVPLSLKKKHQKSISGWSKWKISNTQKNLSYHILVEKNLLLQNLFFYCEWVSVNFNVPAPYVTFSLPCRDVSKLRSGASICFYLTAFTSIPVQLILSWHRHILDRQRNVKKSRCLVSGHFAYTPEKPPCFYPPQSFHDFWLSIHSYVFSIYLLFTFLSLSLSRFDCSSPSRNSPVAFLLRVSPFSLKKHQSTPLIDQNRK